MKKVLIVDDELLLRAHIKSLINWEREGYVLIDEAFNGKEAISIIKDKKPDIILSDVQMPYMDGVELSKYIKENYTDIALIMLSNYDDYKYVRSCLKNGAMDYILKHNLSEKTLISILDKAKSLSLELKEDKIFKNNLIPLREMFVIQVLSGLYYDIDEIKNRMNSLSIKLSYKRNIAISMELDKYDKRSGNIKEKSLLEYTIINICSEILESYGNGLITHIEDEKYIIILSFEDISSDLQINNNITRILNRLSDCLLGFMNLKVTFAIGEVVDTICELKNSYKVANENMKNKFYNGKSLIVTSGISKNNNKNKYVLDIKKEQKIIEFVKARETEKVIQILNEIFNDISKNEAPINISLSIFNDLLSIINRVSKELEIDTKDVYKSNTPPYLILNQYNTFVEICHWIKDIYINLINETKKVENLQYNIYVQQTLNYIKSNYKKDISLSTAGKYVGISPSYLSKIFKDETNQGFVEYLISYRIERAKVYLLKGLNIKEVAYQCGFNDYNYFFRVFKKNVGVTPKSYVLNKEK